MLVDATKTTLLLVDMQERLLPAMTGGAEAEARCAILLKAAKALDVPVTVSEQYPKGLGHTVPGLREEIGNAPVFEKLAFSCWRDPAIKKHMIGHHEKGRPLVILAGIESHVCVMQTAADLSTMGFGVFAVADAMASRAPSSHAPCAGADAAERGGGRQHRDDGVRTAGPGRNRRIQGPVGACSLRGKFPVISAN